MSYPDYTLVWKDIEYSINNMYDFYDSPFRNKQSSQHASSFRPKSSLLSDLLSASKRSRSSDSLDEILNIPLEL